MSEARDPYTLWRERLGGNTTCPVIEGEIPLGFFRFRDKDGSWQPLAIWVNATTATRWHCGPDLETQAPNERLTQLIGFAAKHPVTEENYRHWVTERRWIDDLPGMGDNSAKFDDDDKCAALMRTLDEERLNITAFLAKPIETQEGADRATHWAQRLADLEKTRAEDFKDEKAPHLKECRRVEAKWNEPRDEIVRLRERLRAAQTPFLIAKREAAQKEAAAAEEKRRADFLEGKGRADTKPAEPAKAAQSGARGRRTRIVDVITGKILDMEKALIALKGHPEMISMAQQLVDRAYAKGFEIDGCEKVSTPTTVGG